MLTRVVEQVFGGSPAPSRGRPFDLTRPARRLLITGAAGTVATLLLPWLQRTALMLRGLDRRPVTMPGLESHRSDLRSAEQTDSAASGQDAILHLAAVPSEAGVEALLDDNAVAVAQMLQAAVRQGVGRIVFASSMHVLGMYSRRDAIDECSAPRPDSHYAASKLHGEALCRLYAEKHGLQITCLRLGHVVATLDEAEPASWISPEDVAQLVVTALQRSGPPFEIFNAVADYPGAALQRSRAEAYGYRCRNPGEPYADALARVARMWPTDPVARERRGATFASASTGSHGQDGQSGI